MLVHYLLHPQVVKHSQLQELDLVVQMEKLQLITLIVQFKLN